MFIQTFCLFINDTLGFDKVAMRKKVSFSAVAMGWLVIAAALGVVDRDGTRCRCAPKLPVKEALAKADAVFAGTIVEARVLPDSYPMTDDSTGAVDELEVMVEVTNWWKGAAAPQAKVRTIYECCLCGYPFEKDESYLIYVWEDRETPGLYRTSFCLRTKPLDEAQEEMNQLTKLIE